MKNKLALDFRDNPDVAAALGGKEPGDRVKLEIEVMVTSVDDESFEGDIEGIATEGEDAVEVDSDKPVMAEIIAKRSAKSAVADDEDEDVDETEEASVPA